MKEKELLAALCGDNELISREMAWTELYRQSHDRIVGCLTAKFSSLNCNDIESIYTDASLELMQNIREGKFSTEGKTNAVGYLYVICFRRAIRETKRVAMEQKKFDSIDEADVSGRIFSPSADRAASEKEDSLRFAADLLRRALESLPESCRMMFRMFYWDKLSMQQIAAALGLKNDKTAKTTKNRCMNKYTDIAKKLMGNDADAEDMIREAVERDCLTSLFSELRDNTLASAACDENGKRLKADDADWSAQIDFDALDSEV